MSEQFRCFWIERNDDGSILSSVASNSIDVLLDQQIKRPRVRLRVDYSSVNYKDALAVQGHPGVVKSFPHIPGIDVVGTVAECDDDSFAIGETVFSTGYDLGVGQFGGWSQQVIVPSSAALPLPEGLTKVELVALGTAGFTAAQCVAALRHNSVMPESGPVVVTGATGGVGSLSVKLLARLGYRVVATTGKQDRHEHLKSLGADSVIDRNVFIDDSTRPMLASEFAGGIDTVGGTTLETLLKKVRYRGCVSACGLTSGHELKTTVYPFLLRGLVLVGIDSAMCPMSSRKEIWRLLSGDWKLDGIADLVTQIGLDELPQAVTSILAGRVSGRLVVRV